MSSRSISYASTEIFIQALSFCIKPHLTNLLIHDYQDHADILLTWISSEYYPHFMEDIHNDDNDDIWNWPNGVLSIICD